MLTSHTTHPDSPHPTHCFIIIQPFLLPQASISNPHFPLTHKPHIAYNHSLSPFQYPHPSCTLPYVTITPSTSTLIQPKTSHTPPLQCIIDAMKAHPCNPDVNHQACYALVRLAWENAGNQAAIAAAGGIMVCRPHTPPIPTLPILLLALSIYRLSTS